MSEPSQPSTAPASGLKKKVLGWAAVVAGPALCIWLFNYYIHRPVVHRLYQSPDGRFELTVYRMPSFHLLPSHQPEVDDPGFVSLVRKANQRELKRAQLAKVGVVNQVLWEKEYVEIPQVDAWLLPR